jgi:glycosyltransferase involved in cell wall biosynthesis
VADVRGFLGEIDALVVLSEAEPFSIAILEALRSSVPVIAADSGGTVDIIQPPLNGWLFQSGKATSLAATIESIAKPGAINAVRIDQAALERFTASALAHQWEKIYRDLLSAK